MKTTIISIVIAVAWPCGVQNIIFVLVKNDERLIIQNCSMAWLYTLSGYRIEIIVPWSFALSRWKQGGLGVDPQCLAIFGMLLQITKMLF